MSTKFSSNKCIGVLLSRWTLLGLQDSPIRQQPKQLKQSCEAESPSKFVRSEPLTKRHRPSADTATARPVVQETQLYNTKISFDPDSVDPGALHWIEEGIWPKKYFESSTMSHLIAWKKPTPS